MTHLRRLKKLETLSLTGIDDNPSEITDRSLMLLFELPQFYELSLRDSQVSEEFADDLKAHFFPHGHVFR